MNKKLPPLVDSELSSREDESSLQRTKAELENKEVETDETKQKHVAKLNEFFNPKTEPER